MRSEVLNNVRDHEKSWGVTEKQVIGGRSKITQPNGFDQSDPQVSVDQIDQKCSTAAWVPVFAN